MNKAALFWICALWSAAGLALGPEDFLAKYTAQAREQDPAFAGFSVERGHDFYFTKHRVEDGSELACASCHHEDPRREQYAHHDPIPCRACHGVPDTSTFDMVPKIRRQLLPIAPSANTERFSNDWLVEKWFGKNCRLLLGRDCTPQEKGDFLTWLLTVR